MTDIIEIETRLEEEFGPKDVVHITRSDAAPNEYDFHAYLYTATNRYSITATFRGDNNKNYLGCTASSRKSRAGEDWTRGNDLPDGDLSERTWQRILAGIVRYELQTIHRQDLAKMAAA